MLQSLHMGLDFLCLWFLWIEAAKNGNEKEVKEYAQVFREHANKLIEVSVLVV